MFETLKEIIRSMKRKNHTLKYAKRSIFKDKTKLMWNIYDSKEQGEGLERFHKVHYVFKYKLWMPVIYLARLVLRKYLGKPIPKYNYNQNILIFDDSFEKTIKDWAAMYLSEKLPDGSPKPEALDVNLKCESVKTLRTMKDIVEMMYLNDTAYREFINILMHNISHKMYEAYKGQTVNHLLYTDKNVYNVNYVVMFNKIAEATMKTPEEMEKIQRTIDLGDIHVEGQQVQQDETKKGGSPGVRPERSEPDNSRKEKRAYRRSGEVQKDSASKKPKTG